MADIQFFYLSKTEKNLIYMSDIEEIIFNKCKLKEKII